MQTKPLEKFRRKLDSQRESDRSLADEKIQKISLAIVLALLVATPVTSASALRKLFMMNSFLL